MNVQGNRGAVRVYKSSLKTVVIQKLDEVIDTYSVHLADLEDMNEQDRILSFIRGKIEAFEMMKDYFKQLL